VKVSPSWTPTTRPCRSAASPLLGPQDYLLAVTVGRAVPDPVRVAAARALLPFIRARECTPLKGIAPKDLRRKAALEIENELLAEWAETAAKVPARLKAGKG